VARRSRSDDGLRGGTGRDQRGGGRHRAEEFISRVCDGRRRSGDLLTRLHAVSPLHGGVLVRGDRHPARVRAALTRSRSRQVARQRHGALGCRETDATRVVVSERHPPLGRSRPLHRHLTRNRCGISVRSDLAILRRERVTAPALTPHPPRSPHPDCSAGCGASFRGYEFLGLPERLAPRAGRSRGGSGGRPDAPVTVVAVPRASGWSRAAARARAHDLVENRVQERSRKSTRRRAGANLALIGHLQRNRRSRARAIRAGAFADSLALGRSWTSVRPFRVRVRVLLRERAEGTEERSAAREAAARRPGGGAAAAPARCMTIAPFTRRRACSSARRGSGRGATH